MLLLLCIYVVIFLTFTHKYEIYWINFLKQMLQVVGLADYRITDLTRDHHYAINMMSALASPK